MSTEPRPSEADTWLPHMLDPSPTELLGLFEFCRGLAEALRQYEQHVGDQSLKTVLIQRAINPVPDGWRHLLDALPWSATPDGFPGARQIRCDSNNRY